MSEEIKPASRYSCWYETRNIGAIGKFTPREYVTYGHSTVKEAMVTASEFLRSAGYELRCPVKCNDLTGRALAEAMRPEHYSEGDT